MSTQDCAWSWTWTCDRVAGRGHLRLTDSIGGAAAAPPIVMGGAHPLRIRAGPGLGCRGSPGVGAGRRHAGPSTRWSTASGPAPPPVRSGHQHVSRGTRCGYADDPEPLTRTDQPESPAPGPAQTSGKHTRRDALRSLPGLWVRAPRSPPLSHVRGHMASLLPPPSSPTLVPVGRWAATRLMGYGALARNTPGT